MEREGFHFRLRSSVSFEHEVVGFVNERMQGLQDYFVERYSRLFTRRGGNIEVVEQIEDQFEVFSDGQILFRHSRSSKSTVMVVDGIDLRLPSVETPILEYLDGVALLLQKPQQIALFLEVFLLYVHDSHNPEDPTEKGTKEKHHDYWQSSEQTLRRTEEGLLLGDCEDYAFLARDILRLQGKLAEVLRIPSHGVCVWVEKDAEGRYHASSLGTYGLDVRGVRHGVGKEVFIDEGSGSVTVREAVNLLMKKFEKSDLGIAEGFSYEVGELVELMDVVEVDGHVGFGRRHMVRTVRTESLADAEALQADSNFNDYFLPYLFPSSAFDNKAFGDLSRASSAGILSLNMIAEVVNTPDRMVLALAIVHDQMQVVRALFRRNTISNFNTEEFWIFLTEHHPTVLALEGVFGSYLSWLLARVQGFRGSLSSFDIDKVVLFATEVMQQNIAHAVWYSRLLHLVPYIADERTGKAVLAVAEAYIKQAEHKPSVVAAARDPEILVSLFERFGDVDDFSAHLAKAHVTDPKGYREHALEYDVYLSKGKIRRFLHRLPARVAGWCYRVANSLMAC